MASNSSSSSATQTDEVCPKVCVSISSSLSSSGIRAPPTVDSDLEFSFSTNGRKDGNSTTSSYASDSGFESEEGFLSGEDGFDTASDRTFVADHDDETLGETFYVENFVVPRPSVRNIDNEWSVHGDDYHVPMPLGEDSDVEIVVDSDNVGGHQFSRTFLVDTGGETLETTMVNGEFAATPVELPRPVMPIAHLSVDSDDDYVGSEVVEDHSSLVSAIDSIIGGLENVNIPPKVRVLGVDESEDGSELDNLLEGVVEDSVIGEAATQFSDSDEEEVISMKNSPHHSFAAELEHGVVDDAKAESLVLGEEYISSENSQLTDEIQVAEDIKTLSSDSSTVDVVCANQETKDLNLFGTDITGSQMVESAIGPNLQEMEEDSLHIGSEIVVHNGYDENDVDTDGGFSFNNGSGHEKVEGEIEQDTEFGAEFRHSLSTGRVEAIDNTFGEKEIETLVSVKCSEQRTIKEEGLNVSPKLETEIEIVAEEEEGSLSDDDAEGMKLDVPEAGKHIACEPEPRSALNDLLDGDASQDHSHGIDGDILMESDEDVDTDGESVGKEILDSASLAALLKAAADVGSNSGSSRVFSLDELANSSSSSNYQRHTYQLNRSNSSALSDLLIRGKPVDILSEEERNKLEKIQQIRVKFLRLVSRLSCHPEDSIAVQVLFRLVVAAGTFSSQADDSLESAKRTAMELEAGGSNDLDFSLNVLVLGKTGVGKSSTINSIFGANRTMISAFEPATSAVKEIMGTIDGVKIRVLDTPGLRSSPTEKSFNRKVLSSIKKFIKKCPPDVVLYVDRVDAPARDLNDLPLLRLITDYLGPSIWRNAIVTLTHGASTPSDGPSGLPLSYKVFVGERALVVQQLIGHAIGDLHMMNPGLTAPVCPVENHPFCKKNSKGQMVLPNGESWRSQLLLLCYSMKILAEATFVIKHPEPLDSKKLFGFQIRPPSLPHFLSSLFQSQAHPKLPSDQVDITDSENVLWLSDSDEEDENEYDQLPPFKPLKKSQVSNLSKEQRKAYYEEYDYRVKLLQKKQLKEEVKRLREMKRAGKDSSVLDNSFVEEDGDQEIGSPDTIAVPLPDMALPPTFDGDNPVYRYRYLQPTSQFLCRPVLHTQSWDHDCGYDGLSLEDNFAIAGQFPGTISVQITKDKKEFNMQLESAVSAKHGDHASTLAGLEIQTVRNQFMYTLKGESKAKILKKNRAAAGACVTFMGENLISGFKLEDQIDVGKRLVLVGSTGAVRSKGDLAYGANLEVRLKDKDFPIEQAQTAIGLSLVRWRRDLVWGCNLQSQFSVGRNSNVAIRAGLNNKFSGQISVRTSSSDQLQIAFVGLLPVAKTIFRNIFLQSDEKLSKF